MVSHYRALGYEVATELVTPEKRGAAYVDTVAALGHMVEIYRVNETLYDFYAMIADAARDWDGQNLVIET